jgi:ankyrin repeat protein
MAEREEREREEREREEREYQAEHEREEREEREEQEREDQEEQEYRYIENLVKDGRINKFISELESGSLTSFTSDDTDDIMKFVYLAISHDSIQLMEYLIKNVDLEGINYLDYIGSMVFIKYFIATGELILKPSLLQSIYMHGDEETFLLIDLLINEFNEMEMQIPINKLLIYSSSSMRRILIERYGADVNYRWVGRSYDRPIIFNPLGDLVYLLSKGADFNIVDTKGNTPLLRFAILLADEEVEEAEEEELNKEVINELLYDMKILIDKGADPSVVNKKGQSLMSLLPRKYRRIFFPSYNPFKAGSKKIMNLLKTQTLFKWQNLCSQLGNNNISELREIAKLHEIKIKGHTKREICKELSMKTEKLLKTNTGMCENQSSILGDEVSDILGPLLFKFKENGRFYCFNIIELYQLIKSGDTRNPFTRNQLPVEKIKSQYKYLQQILNSNALELVDTIDQIRNSPIFNKQQLQLHNLTGILSKLNYPRDSSIVYEELNDSEIRKKYVGKLKEAGINIRSNISLDNLIIELTALANDPNTHTSLSYAFN